MVSISTLFENFNNSESKHITLMNDFDHSVFESQDFLDYIDSEIKIAPNSVVNRIKTYANNLTDEIFSVCCN